MNGNFDLVIGLDTEYVRGSELDDSVPDDDNAVVSYQVALYAPATGQRGSGSFLTEGLTRRHRYSMRGYLNRALAAALDAGMVDPEGEIKIALVAHFTRADLPGFRDFNRLKTRFDAIRKTYCSIKRPTICDLRTPSGVRVKARITLFDTRLLAPAGAGSLGALGSILGFDKLSVPDVVDEMGATRPGIERMDLTLVQHPEAFNDYAVRDAEIAVEWFLKVNELGQRWGLTKPAHTIGSMAVTKFVQFAENMPGLDLLGFLGKHRVGRKIETRDELRNVRRLAADCFHGGRNECFKHGVFREPSFDWDLKGAYTTALAMFRELDWARTEHTTDLDRLAVLDAATFARVKFQSPPGTRFPSLPVDADPHGLIYPLLGESCATGPELVVALEHGATITVIEGVFIPWRDPDGPRPFLEFIKLINQERGRHDKGSPLELLAKEAGNSVYGKTAQAVASHKTPPKRKRAFDTRVGQMEDLPESRITQPIIAALTTGLLRALLSEIIAMLPDHVRLYTATTDGWLSTATETEVLAAATGPVARYFSSLRALADPNGDASILEMKHSASALIVFKTRGTFTVEPGGPMPKPIIARAGHRLEKPVADERAEWERIFRARDYHMRMLRKPFISVRQQWYENADLIEMPRMSRANLDYDLKRRPVNVHDHEGLVRFTTVPWPDIDTFFEHRGAFKRWRGSAQACLKTTEDWYRFLGWKQAPRSGAASSRSQFGNAVVAGFARGLPGFPIRGRGRYGKGMSRAAAASWLASLGITDVTTKAFENSRAREADPRGTVAILTPGDHELIAKLLPTLSREAIMSLLTESAAATVQTEVMPITAIPSGPAEEPDNADPARTTIDVA